MHVTWNDALVNNLKSVLNGRKKSAAILECLLIIISLCIANRLFVLSDCLLCVNGTLVYLIIKRSDLCSRINNQLNTQVFMSNMRKNTCSSESA